MARLRGYIDDTVTEIQVDDTTDLPTNGGVLDVESEKISYTYATDKAVFGCTRGYDGTVAVEHADGTLVEPEDTVEPLYILQEYNGHGAPIDNQTGVKQMPKGTRYTDLDSALMYINVGDADEPTWQPFAEGASGGASGPLGAVQLSDGAGAFINDPMFLWRESDNTLRLGTAAEGVALSLTSTSGAYIYFADEDVSASTARIFQAQPTDPLVVLGEDAVGVRIQSEGEAVEIHAAANVNVLSDGGDISLTTVSGNVRADIAGGAFKLRKGGNDWLIADANTESNLRIQGEGSNLGTVFTMGADGNNFFSLTNQANNVSYGTLSGGSDTGGDFNLSADTADLNLSSTSGVVTVTAQGETCFTVDGNGQTTFPGRASDGYNEIRIRGEAGAYIDFYHNDLTTLSTRIINNVGIDFSVHTPDALHLSSDGETSLAIGATTYLILDSDGIRPGVVMNLWHATTAERDALTVLAGSMLYNADTNKINFFNGSTWEVVTSA